MSILTKMLEVLGVPSFALLCIGAFFGILWIVKKYYFTCMNSSDDRKNLLAELEAANGWKIAYHALLQRVLDQFDFWLAPSYDNAVRPELTNASFKQAMFWFWPGRAFGINLIIAVFYPVVLLILFWVFGNINTSGLDGVLPGNLSDGRRYATLTLLCIAGFSIYQSTGQHTRKNVFWLIAAAAAALVAVGAGAAAVAVVVVAVAAAVGSAAGIGAGAGAVAVAAAVAAAVTAAVAVVAVAAVGAAAGIGAVAVVAAVAGAIVGSAVSVGAAVVYFYIGAERVGKTGMYFFIYSMLMFFLIGIAFRFVAITGNDFSIYNLIFVTIIALINAAYDFLSFGLTRYLLQKSLDRGKGFFAYAVLDFGAACLFLVALSLTIVAALAMLNLVAAGHRAHPIDLGGVLTRLRHTSGEISLWWIYLMIFSTFLPTFFHAGVALANMPITRIFPKWRKELVTGIKRLERGGDSHKVLVSGAWYFAIQRCSVTVMTLTVIGVLGSLLCLYLPGLAKVILFMCEWLAQALGEDISPGRIFPFFGTVLT